jgi:hypothetical protein
MYIVVSFLFSEKLRKLVIAKQSPEYIIKLSKTEIEKGW